MITLTSDFGLRDPYVGIMKSRIVQRAPQVPIVDLTHEITPFAAEEAGYWLYCSAPQFPAGTVHVAVVDPGVGSERAILVAEAGGQSFIAPDNGLLGLIAQAVADARFFRVEESALTQLGIGYRSATFHGRDVMAPIAAELALGRLGAADVGPPHRPEPGRMRCAAMMPDGSIGGTVGLVDHYGNALTTIRGSWLERLRTAEIRVGARRIRRVRTYNEAAPGECVTLINSSGMLEIAARQGSAAALLNIEPGAPVYVVEGPEPGGE